MLAARRCGDTWGDEANGAASASTGPCLASGAGAAPRAPSPAPGRACRSSRRRLGYLFGLIGRSPSAACCWPSWASASASWPSDDPCVDVEREEGQNQNCLGHGVLLQFPCPLFAMLSPGPKGSCPPIRWEASYPLRPLDLRLSCEPTLRNHPGRRSVPAVPPPSHVAAQVLPAGLMHGKGGRMPQRCSTPASGWPRPRRRGSPRRQAGAGGGTGLLAFPGAGQALAAVLGRSGAFLSGG
jgi:hypothetical protein